MAQTMMIVRRNSVRVSRCMGLALFVIASVVRAPLNIIVIGSRMRRAGVIVVDVIVFAVEHFLIVSLAYAVEAVACATVFAGLTITLT